MADAEVGDDLFGDDPTVNLLQERAAELTGKQAALYLPTAPSAMRVSVMLFGRGRDPAAQGHQHASSL